ncbi:MAG: hypothetical protein JSS35_08885 [Proteobacteria bacterium]|nr:hypothetical protein [Pseudomonadota bacterium]
MDLEFDRSRLFEAEGEAERQRVLAHRREAERNGGVRWSGLAAEAVVRHSPADLTRAADLRLAALQRWRVSSPGRILAALAQAERAVEALRAALARGLGPDDRRYAQALSELEIATSATRRAMQAQEPALTEPG